MFNRKKLTITVLSSFLVLFTSIAISLDSPRKVVITGEQVQKMSELRTKIIQSNAIQSQSKLNKVPQQIEDLESNNQIAFKYKYDNPNGSIANIAGILNKEKNILGMMPHPERASDLALGSNNGYKIFQSILES